MAISSSIKPCRAYTKQSISDSNAIITYEVAKKVQIKYQEMIKLISSKEE
jgi:hypothetical protein